MNNMDFVEKCKEILMRYENIIFAYIFGSYVKGNLKKDSDIDIAIYLNKSIDPMTYLHGSNRNL